MGHERGKLVAATTKHARMLSGLEFSRRDSSLLARRRSRRHSLLARRCEAAWPAAAHFLSHVSVSERESPDERNYEANDGTHAKAKMSRWRRLRMRDSAGIGQPGQGALLAAVTGGKRADVNRTYHPPQH